MIRAARTALMPLACMALAVQVAAQTYSFRTIGRDEGVTSPFTHALAQDARGYLWIGTGEGAARFDGRKARLFTTADGLAENTVSAVHVAADGTVWIGHNEGGLSRWGDGRFEAVDLAGLSTSMITAIADDDADGLWITALNNGLLHMDASGTARKMSPPGDPALWYSLLGSPDGRLLAGRSDGCHVISTVGAAITITALHEVTSAPVLALAAIGPRVFAGTDGEGVISFTMDGDNVLDLRTLETGDLRNTQVKDLTTDAAGHLIVATFGQGAYEIVFDPQGALLSAVRYHLGNGLGSDNVSVAFIDREDVLWLACFSKGVARRTDRAVTLYAAGNEPVTEVRSVAVDGDRVLFGATGMILRVSRASGAVVDTLGAERGLPPDAITALLATKGTIWAGTERSGLFTYTDQGLFERVRLGNDHLSDHIHGLAMRGSDLLVATGNGVYVISNGATRHLTTVTGLPHNQVNAVFTDRNGQAWMGCNNGGIAYFDGNELRRFTPKGINAAHHISGIAQDADGVMWFATQGGGIWRGSQGQTMAVTTVQGLGSDFVTSIIADGSGHLWAAHRGGISIIDSRTFQVKVLGKEFGMGPDRKSFALAADGSGALVLGTDDGALRYDASMRGSPVAPRGVDIIAVRAFDRELDLDGPIELAPDAYRLTFDFIGISLKDPDAITYQYKLEGLDLEWNTTTEPTVVYRRVEDGDLRFLVRACNGPACSTSTASLTLTVLAPLWKRGWFIALVTMVLAITIIAIVQARLSNQRHLQEYLKRTLDERTREVQARTVELARKNKDITDSITYARRIQQAALPSEPQLREHFPRSFIFHQPRDIVSGDFYWFRRFDHKFLLACADCTGHGVPGAFMSMIGSLLLRDISSDRTVTSPAAVLTQLDSELRSVLGYNGTGHRSNDGMDISVCEIDMNTQRLRASCAMHDLLLYREGELVRLKGERSSIGGIQRNGQPNTFAMVEHELKPGDRIYLFSDGIPDQFGGLHGKKLKVSGLIEFVESFCHLHMDEQSHLFRSKFLSWMNGHDQVDDVLFIGIEV